MAGKTLGCFSLKNPRENRKKPGLFSYSMKQAGVKNFRFKKLKVFWRRINFYTIIKGKNGTVRNLFQT